MCFDEGQGASYEGQHRTPRPALAYDVNIRSCEPYIHHNTTTYLLVPGARTATRVLVGSKGRPTEDEPECRRCRVDDGLPSRPIPWEEVCVCVCGCAWAPGAAVRRRGLSGSKQVRYDLSCSRSGSAGLGVALCRRNRATGREKSEAWLTSPFRETTMILVDVAAPLGCVVRDAGWPQSHHMRENHNHDQRRQPYGLGRLEQRQHTTTVRLKHHVAAKHASAVGICKQEACVLLSCARHRQGKSHGGQRSTMSPSAYPPRLSSLTHVTSSAIMRRYAP